VPVEGTEDAVGDIVGGAVVGAIGGGGVVGTTAYSKTKTIRMHQTTFHQ